MPFAPERRSRLAGILTFLYGERGPATLHALEGKVASAPETADRRAFTERDAILITYGDMISAPDEAPLQTLGAFLDRYVAPVMSGVHLLPFYPWSSDDGFSVIDYRSVDPALGSWDDVEDIGARFDLMVDAVINHISVHSAWFRGFLAGDARYADFFHVVDPAVDLSAVFRPRALPLLTEFTTSAGRRHVWTTFSADQVDLNFANPEVLLAVVDVLLDYVAHGASLIRLDAVGFLWKVPGTSSIHLPQTHAVIKALRLILDEAAPQVALITETNVPHADNVSYFGDGHDEAQMVYNFSLPPLTVHAFHTGTAETLARWAAGLSTPSSQTTFFNFLASHDGIGVTPAQGWLSDAEIADMAERVEDLGGLVSERATADGGRRPYELNIGFLDALGDPALPASPGATAQRMAAAYAIACSLPGVPGVYFHSLVGSRSWLEGPAETGRARTINRQRLEAGPLRAELEDPGSLRHAVYDHISRLLRTRAACPAFHPAAASGIHTDGPAVLTVVRTSLDGETRVRCLHNVSARPVTAETHGGVDLLTGDTVPAGAMHLGPHGVVWLQEVGA